MLHDFRSIDWDAWRDAPERHRSSALEEGIDFLDAPIVRVGAPFTPVPFARPLEQAYRVTPEKIAEAIRGLF